MLDFSRKPIIGYVQLDELTEESFDYAYAKALLDAFHLEDGGADAIVVENYAEPETGAIASAESKKYMEPICAKLRQIIKRASLGVNVLQADLIAAFELARRYSFDFVHADVYADIVRSRETGAVIQVGLEYVSKLRRDAPAHIPLIATVKPWHAYEVLADEEIEQSALKAVEYGADALAVVGKNGAQPDINDIQRVESAVHIPVGAGTGINDKTLELYFPISDFFLVSGFFKYGGKKSNPVDKDRVRQLMDIKHGFSDY